MTPKVTNTYDLSTLFVLSFVIVLFLFSEEFLNYLLKGLHEDVNLVRKKPSIKFDEQAWDRMNDVEKSNEHWAINLKIENSRISGIVSV